MKNLFIAAVFGGLAFGCSQDSPTTPIAPNTPFDGRDTIVPSPAIEADIQEYQNRLRTTLDQMRQERPLTVHEDFTCENVEEVRVRFSDPGFIDGLGVGMFVKFVGIPAATKTLRIWWDHETADDVYQDVPVGDGDVNPEDAGRFDVEMVIEHGYTTAGDKRVRVELILEGLTGNCSRNRDIFVTPESFDHVASFGGVAACNTFGGMGIRVNLTPPIPAGTPYTVRARLDGAGVFVPTFMNVIFSNAAGPDFAFTPPQIGFPPAVFTATMTPSVPHRQLLVASQFGFPPPTSMNLRIVSISVPGRTVGLSGAISGNCP